MEKVSYQGWPNCYRLATQDVELIVTGDVGPRIIRFGFAGGENEFVEFPEDQGQMGGTEWRKYGGHRLWYAPESLTHSYYPDNQPVEVVRVGEGLKVVQPVEPLSGIQKSIVATFRGPNQLEVRHLVQNVGAKAVELAPWALTMMTTGGMAIVPQPTKADPDRLLHNRVIALWPYTDMADPRIQWGTGFLLLRQDPQAQTPFKLGLSANDGWLAYLRGEHLFLKTFEYVDGAVYPDGGSSVEVYTNDQFLELETLGPLGNLAPGDVAEHVERWFLFDGVAPQADDEKALADVILPLVATALAGLR